MTNRTAKTNWSHANQLTLLGLVMLLGLILLSSACQTMTAASAKPFNQFVESTAQVSQGLDKALATSKSMSEERFIKDALAKAEKEDFTEVDSLVLKSTQKVMHWDRRNAPLFLKVETFNLAANQMTQALQTYAQTLAKLASPELISIEKFDELSTDLNIQSKAAYSLLSGKDNPSDEETALISTIATTAFKSYIDDKQVRSLQEAMKENQKQITKFSGHMAEGILTAVKHHKTEYNKKINEHLRNFQAVDKNGKPRADRPVHLNKMIETNRIFIHNMEVFQRAYSTFKILPSAHRQLYESLDKPASTLTIVNTFMQEGLRLATTYKANLHANRITTAQAKVDALSAQVDETSSQIEKATYQSKLIQYRLDIAKRELEKDKQNEKLQEEVERLEERLISVQDRISLLELRKEREQARVEDAKAELGNLKETQADSDQKS